MNWFNRVRNSLAFLPKRATEKDLWVKCPGCQQMVFAQEYAENLQVCPRCEHHGRIGADERLRQLLDEGYDVLPQPEVREDPLKFRDTKKYTDRLKQARAKNPHRDAFTVGSGTIEERPAVVGVQDFGFMGGSMGMAVGTAFCQGAERALTRRCPYIVVTAAGGARMQEGILSLMQMPKATVMTRRLKEAGLPYIVVLTDPTTGGVTASYAMLGDIHIAEPGALIGFAGQRVIQDTIREQLPEGFQRAEYLHKHGMVDMVVHRHDLRDRLATVLDYLQPKVAA
ncbi:acetyl-CoA carboxylase, carboxyltransferase subunit beta [Qipengyuania sp. DY56-A-20]|jgi:acetyl-CoA carboxylase carboxyl transferase subunit beta|uniref:Acetyl-coenzyme A carboxylase carboxyl transferase subunit beta n=1 Tax=Qipengyuania benthica TaxID=3067651 RepID=A0ABT9H8K8_9SPHN|nr:acetyl-CoA carboxylase, carboxyltransferase subunit beta [Qipengyuania sp. DY56-A-20]MBU1255032.1 acetyl-CoA carboxylase, carboxyltransferase subunit beta [Alphaproteobacteria bacterium]MBU1605946.1 acetyl-CoA carboxylase, carboxyltransferase subunit beta [Alphaproteobacteria bacterium]MDP4539645.1 acetyl-CoA carboxylase, carboxyltransferase subunit beta [Qipengyuania sp. DY56-A-20]